jgi:hypothetical protein
MSTTDRFNRRTLLTVRDAPRLDNMPRLAGPTWNKVLKGQTDVALKRYAFAHSCQDEGHSPAC